MMRSRFLLFVACSITLCAAELTRQECADQGGEVVGDIGNGAIFQPGYLCASNGLAPIDVVVPSPGEPIAIEGEVCCGGSDDDVEELSEEECTELGGTVVEDAVICPDQQSAIGTITATTSRQSTTALCCPPEANVFPPPPSTNRTVLTRQECLDQNGTIVGDIGNGDIFTPDYVCERNGEAPVANIVQPDIDSGEPIAIEGEVCCGPEELPGDFDDDEEEPEIPEEELEEEREEVTRQECTEELGGEIVGDIGDGATRREDYVCASSGEPPLANIVPAEDESIPIEGEVCCGTTPTNTTADKEAANIPGDGAASRIMASSLYFAAVVSAVLWGFGM